MGVVVHRPKVIDSGFALKVLNRLRSLGEVTTVLEGTKERLTIIDPGLRLLRQLRCFVGIPERPKGSSSLQMLDSLTSPRLELDDFSYEPP